jgi:hypothetical protein
MKTHILAVDATALKVPRASAMITNDFTPHSRQIRDMGDIRDSFVIATIPRKCTCERRRIRDIRDANG